MHIQAARANCGTITTVFTTNNSVRGTNHGSFLPTADSKARST